MVAKNRRATSKAHKEKTKFDNIPVGNEPEGTVKKFGPYESKLSGSYLTIRAFNIGRGPINRGEITPGKINVFLVDDDEFCTEGTLFQNGNISGMSKLLSKLNATENDTFKFWITSSSEGSSVLIQQTTVKPKVLPKKTTNIGKGTLFERSNLRYVHIEAFRPENLNNWEPETETDVYMAFGVLEEYTDYKYCCGVSQSLLCKLGAKYQESSKPDAILISRISDSYLMAEWKKKSSDYKINHNPEDVDVLVVWHDDESNRHVLPTHVLCLRTIARLAATAVLAVDQS